MLFSFVILHYGDAAVTMAAVKSVLALNPEEHDVKVVVVDNASPNETGKVVQDLVEPFPNVFFLASDKNLGFARGNNIGFRFAKDELKSDFVILMNNDAVIESPDFCKLVVDDFRQEQFAVLGPYIHTPNGKCQNPLRKKLLKGFRLKVTQTYLYVDFVMTWLFIAPIMLKMFARRRGASSNKELVAVNDVELHGSFLVFSPLYIQKFDGLDDRTFMYCEEEFLFARCVANGMKSRYNPCIKVFHNEKESSCARVLVMRRKALFRIKNCLESLALYCQYLKVLD